MRLPRRILALGAAAATAVACPGCGAAKAPGPRAGDPFAYDHNQPLRAAVTELGRHDGVRVQHVTYAGGGGQRVPALLALPRAKPSQGCVIFQGDLGVRKERAAPFWPGAADLGLSVFTIDARGTGERAVAGQPMDTQLHDAGRIVAMLRADVVDLRRGIDYLESRREYRRNVGYLGTSMGGLLGALLSGADDRVHATVLTSIGATWREGILYSEGTVLPGVARDPRAFERAVRTLAPYDAGRWVPRIAPRPLMLVDGRRDPRVPLVDALNLAAAARDPKRLVLHGGGHDPFAPPSGDGVATRVAGFLLNELTDYAGG